MHTIPHFASHRHVAAKPAPEKRQPYARGNMKPAEIKPLVMIARKAYDYMTQMGVIEDAEPFDAWRHRQCLEAVGQPGITACSHEDFRPLLAHFQHLAGDDGEAFANSITGGKASDHAAPGDTHEARRQLAWCIATHLSEHLCLAESSVDQLIAAAAENWYRERPDESYPGPDPQWLSQIKSRKAAIEAKGKGPVGVGYLIYLVRQKTRRPELQLGKNWQAGLAERCTVSQLDQILFTLVNRISAAEGFGTSTGRNKAQRSSAGKASRSPDVLDPRF
ncbi:MAG: hypothetical protein WCP45_08425 [Verrucomicrobiota bacterium]